MFGIIELTEQMKRANRLTGRLIRILIELFGEETEAESATLTLLNSKGEAMDLTAKLTDKPGVAKYQEFDGPNGTGNPVAAKSLSGYKSSNTAVATVDPVTGQLTYIGVGTTVISNDDSGALPASATLTLTSGTGTAVSATMTLTAGA